MLLVGHVSLRKGETLFCCLNTHIIFINYKKSSIDYGMRHKVGHGVCQRKICCTCMIKILLKVRSLTVEKHLVFSNSGSERLVSNFYTRFQSEVALTFYTHTQWNTHNICPTRHLVGCVIYMFWQNTWNMKQPITGLKSQLVGDSQYAIQAWPRR